MRRRPAKPTRKPASAGANPGPHTFAAATTEVADGMARICRLYGISPALGRLYAALYVHAGPVSLEDLCEQVGAAKSTVSVALRKLLAARVVQRLPPRGDRRDYYEVVPDPWTVLGDWNRLYFQPELEMWKTARVSLERALAAAPDAPKGDAKRELAERMEGMSEFTDLLEQMLGGLRSSRNAAATPARSISVRFGAPGRGGKR